MDKWNWETRAAYNYFHLEVPQFTGESVLGVSDVEDLESILENELETELSGVTVLRNVVCEAFLENVNFTGVARELWKLYRTEEGTK